MKTVPIPAASLARLQQAQAQFEILAATIAEAMGLDPEQRTRLDLPNKCYVIDEESPNGTPQAQMTTSPT